MVTLTFWCLRFSRKYVQFKFLSENGFVSYNGTGTNSMRRHSWEISKEEPSIAGSRISDIPSKNTNHWLLLPCVDSLQKKWSNENAGFTNSHKAFRHENYNLNLHESIIRKSIRTLTNYSDIILCHERLCHNVTFFTGNIEPPLISRDILVCSSKTPACSYRTVDGELR